MRPPFEGAIYAAAGGVFTLVLLLAQVLSISPLALSSFALVH